MTETRKGEKFATPEQREYARSLVVGADFYLVEVEKALAEGVPLVYLGLLHDQLQAARIACVRRSFAEHLFVDINAPLSPLATLYLVNGIVKVEEVSYRPGDQDDFEKGGKNSLLMKSWEAISKEEYQTLSEVLQRSQENVSKQIPVTA